MAGLSAKWLSWRVGSQSVRRTRRPTGSEGWGEGRSRNEELRKLHKARPCVLRTEQHRLSSLFPFQASLRELRRSASALRYLVQSWLNLLECEQSCPSEKVWVFLHLLLRTIDVSPWLFVIVIFVTIHRLLLRRSSLYSIIIFYPLTPFHQFHHQVFCEFCLNL